MLQTGDRNPIIKSLFQIEESDLKLPTTNQVEKNEVVDPRIESTVDLIGRDSTLLTAGVAMMLYLVKFTTFVAIAAYSSMTVDEDTSALAVGIARTFAVVSMVTTGFPALKSIAYNSLASFQVTATKFQMQEEVSYFETLLKGLLMIAELGNLAMLYICGIFIIPTQKSPLNIVLIATALLTIASIDESFFTCFAFTAKVTEGHVKAYDQIVKDTAFARWFIFAISLFFTLFVMNFLYCLNAYIP